MNDQMIHQPHEGHEVTPQLTSLEAQTRGEVDIQISTAKRYPRSVTTFVKQATELVTLTEDIAESCIYALPRDGKTIEGPSARFAEIVASCWGHMRVEGRPIDDEGKFVTCRGTAWDLERNVAIAFEVKRRITNRKGERFSDDMITVASNAGTSIALRNAILKVVPAAFWKPMYEAARKAAVGDVQTLANKRAAMLAYFQKLGVPPARVFAKLGVAGEADISLDHLATLKGIATALKDGEAQVDDIFAADAPSEPQRKTAAPTEATPAEAPTPSAAATAKPDHAVRGTITAATFVADDAGHKHYRIEIQSGKVRQVYITPDESLFTAAATVEGTDHEVAGTYRSGRLDKKPVLVLTSLALVEGGASA